MEEYDRILYAFDRLLGYKLINHHSKFIIRNRFLLQESS